MVLGWPPSKIMSSDPDFQPRWPPRKKGDDFFFWIFLWNYWANLNQTLLKWSLGGPLPKLCPHFRPPTKMATTAELSLTEDLMGNSHTNLLRNHWVNCNQTLVEWSLDDPLPKLCPVIPISNQDGRQAKNRKKGGWNFKKSSPQKLLSQSQPNFAEMILGWSPSKIVSGISDLRPRWPPQPNLI